MKKVLITASSAFLAFVIAGCGNDEAAKTNGEDGKEVAVVPISVELTVPETGEKDAKIILQSTVKQGKEKVDDANEVVYEIWEDGKKESSRKVESEQVEDGLYQAETSFEKDGIYNVQVHVTARDMHTMPTKKITIGQGAEHAHHEGNDHHATEGFSMHFVQPKEVKAGEPVDMVVHLQEEGNPMEKARVRLEIIVNEKTQEAQWIPLKESKPGEYKEQTKIVKGGNASITVHVENDNGLHEHETHKIKVANE